MAFHGYRGVRLACLALAAFLIVPLRGMTVSDLRCEYRCDPLGLDIAHPRLGWRLQSDRRGERQTAYQIVVASTPEALAQGRGDLWDSGQVESDAQNQVAYAGAPLGSRARCWWKVRAWDADGKPSEWSSPALWTMGLLEPADWEAAWIGLDDDAPSQDGPPLQITRATFEGEHGEGARDVTARVAQRVKGNRLKMVVTSDPLGGDPAPGTRKKLVVEYTIDGQPGTVMAMENTLLRLQDDSDSVFPLPRTLRTAFHVDRPVRRATLYATALGLYEMRLNGARVGDRLLTPEWTDYDKRVQYQTYDVTDQIRPGENALGALLGNGWYCGGWQHFDGPLRPIHDAKPQLKAQLEIEYADGGRQVVTTGDSWRGTLDGPLRFSGIDEGETYDARKEMPGWDAPGFDDAAWQSAVISKPAAGKLVWQRSEPIRVEMDFPAIKVTEPKPGVYVFDFGQNIAGWCRLRVDAPAGTALSLRFNEVLNPDGTVYMDNLHAGHLSSGDDRQVVRYICRGGGPEEYEPHFTYQGFRYAEVRGLPSKPDAGLLTARAFHTDFPHAGDFACSSELVTKLAQNIQWSQRDNMMGVPTDCCQRDERCGYTGDMNFFIRAAVYNFDIAAFTTKWLFDVSDAQQPDGWFPDFAPWFAHAGNNPNVGWTDAGILCTYAVWQTYGDTTVIQDHYEALRRNLAWVKTQMKDHLHTGRVGNGDWLTLGGSASAGVIGTAYDYYDFALMAKMARAIGHEEDAKTDEAEAAKIAEAFAAAFIDPDGAIKESSQTGYALAFTMGLVPPDKEKAMAAKFAGEIEHYHDHLATGFLGTPRLLPALRLAGRDDLACKILLQEDYPGWLFEIKNGATTTWERWNGWGPGGFADSGMNSFNHYSFGAVGEYLYAALGGISSTDPGYRTIRIAPVTTQGITWAKTRYDSIQGPIETDWKRDTDGLSLAVTIPPNATATVEIPATDPAKVKEGDHPAAEAPGVRLVSFQDGMATYAVGSGTYRFRTPPER